MMYNMILKESTEIDQIFVLSDMTDSWIKITDVQKAELRKVFATIRAKNNLDKIITFKIDYKITGELTK